MIKRIKYFEVIKIMFVFLIGIAVGKVEFENSYIFSKGMLRDCKMYIYNQTCTNIYEQRTVYDMEFYNDVLTLCLKAKRFRPISSLEIIAGEQEDESVQYIVSFHDVKNQMSIDNIYRDEPLIAVGWANKDELGRCGALTSWYCYLDPEVYVLLYDLLARYSGGDLRTMD